MKLLANPKDKEGNQEKSPAKKKLSEFARTLKKVDVGAALRTMRQRLRWRLIGVRSRALRVELPRAPLPHC